MQQRQANEDIGTLPLSVNPPMHFSGSPRGRRPRRRRPLAAGAFVIPTLVLVGIFVAAPLVDVVRLSMTSWDGVDPARYVGDSNFRFLLHSSQFHQVLLNTMLLVCGIAVWITVPFTLAILLHRKKRADLVRTVLFVPVLLPPVVAGEVFRIVLADNGPVNSLLRSMHLHWLAQPWLTSQNVVLLTVVGVIAWAVMGSGVMFFSAGLTAIDPALVEAAEIDGAGWWRLVWNIYRPLLRPVSRFWILLLTVSTVTAFFPWIYGLTQGGPGISSTTLDYDLYQTGLVDGQYGLACAIAVAIILLVAIFIAVQSVAHRLRPSNV